MRQEPLQRVRRDHLVEGEPPNLLAHPVLEDGADRRCVRHRRQPDRGVDEAGRARVLRRAQVVLVHRKHGGVREFLGEQAGDPAEEAGPDLRRLRSRDPGQPGVGVVQYEHRAQPVRGDHVQDLPSLLDDLLTRSAGGIRGTGRGQLSGQLHAGTEPLRRDAQLRQPTRRPALDDPVDPALVGRMRMPDVACDRLHHVAGEGHRVHGDRPVLDRDRHRQRCESLDQRAEDVGRHAGLACPALPDQGHPLTPSQRPVQRGLAATGALHRVEGHVVTPQVGMAGSGIERVSVLQSHQQLGAQRPHLLVGPSTRYTAWDRPFGPRSADYLRVAEVVSGFAPRVTRMH